MSLKNNRKGQLLMSMAIFFVIIAASFVIALVSGVWIFASQTITTQLINVPSSAVANFSEAAQITFGNYNQAVVQLRFISFLVIFGMFFAIFLTYTMQKAHRGFFILYFLMMTVAVFTSIIIANSYETLVSQSGPVGDVLNSMRGTTYLLLNLPIWVSVIGMIGAIFLFTQLDLGQPRGGF